jgi:hypothetical protein
MGHANKIFKICLRLTLEEIDFFVKQKTNLNIFSGVTTGFQSSLGYSEETSTLLFCGGKFVS